MILKVKITKDILKRSMMCEIDKDCVPIIESCAIALCIRDIFPTAVVSGEYITYYLDEDFITTAFNVLLPKSAQLFISMFDDKRNNPILRLEMDEIEFEIDVPEEVVNSINIENITKLLINHPTLEMV